jgi:transposase-like protein
MAQNPATLNLQTVLAWSDEEAHDFFEAMRWPNGPICPKCGAENPYMFRRLVNKATMRMRKLYKCRACKRQFTATVGSIFEDSHIPLNKWIGAIFIIVGSKKGVSAHQLHRQLWTAEHPGTYKSAWFMFHRIREAMKERNIGQLFGVVEADETYIGPRTKRGAPNSGPTHLERREGKGPKFQPVGGKQVVFGMMERGGRVRTMHIGKDRNPKAEVVKPLLRQHIDFENSHLMTDEASIYQRISEELPHDIIRHKSEYVRGEVHTQNIEGYWAILKRGLFGVYQHVDAGYLGRYLDEFAYRFNSRTLTDAERFCLLLGQTQGRVKWYCRTEQPANPYA